MAFVRIKSPTASQIVESFNPQPDAVGLLKPNQTPEQYVTALEQKNLSGDAIQVLANGLPERDAVDWACQSCDRVSPQMAWRRSPSLDAAKQWVQNPTPETKAAAAAAAAQSEMKAPGDLAAQAVAWSGSPDGAAMAAGPTGAAVAGSVLSAAAIETPPAVVGPALPSAPGPPELPTVPSIDLSGPEAPKVELPSVEAPAVQIPDNVLAEQAKAHKPYLDLGKEIAAGKSSFSSPAPGVVVDSGGPSITLA